MPELTSLKVKIDGMPVSDRHALESLVVDNAVNLPDSFVATYVDPEGEVLKEFSGYLGSSIRIEIGIDNGTQVALFDGEMTAIEVDYDAGHSGQGTRPSLVAWTRHTTSTTDGRPRRGSRRRRRRSPSKSPARPGFRRHGRRHLDDLRAHRPRKSHRPGIRQEAGVGQRQGGRRIRWQVPLPQPGTGVRRTSAGGRVTTAGHDPLQLVAQGNLIALHATIRSSGQVGSVEVRGWDPEAKQLVTSTASASTKTAHAGITPAALAAKAGGATHSPWVRRTASRVRPMPPPTP